MEQKEFIFNLLRRAIQALALSADEQIELHLGAVITDELLLDFDNASTAILSNYKETLSSRQIDQLDKINTKIDEIQNSEKSIFELSSLQNNEHWKQLRKLGKDALKEFGWDLEIPPITKI